MRRTPDLTIVSVPGHQSLIFVSFQGHTSTTVVSVPGRHSQLLRPFQVTRVSCVSQATRVIQLCRPPESGSCVHSKPPDPDRLSELTFVCVPGSEAKFQKIGGEASLTAKICPSHKTRYLIYSMVSSVSNYWPSSQSNGRTKKKLILPSFLSEC